MPCEFLNWGCHVSSGSALDDSHRRQPHRRQFADGVVDGTSGDFLVSAGSFCLVALRLSSDTDVCVCCVVNIGMRGAWSIAPMTSIYATRSIPLMRRLDMTT